LDHHEDLIESQIPINSRFLLTSLSRFAKSFIVLLKYLIFGGKSPEVGPKNTFSWMNPRVLKPKRGCRSRCLRGKDAAPLLELLPRQAGLGLHR
jgi:hypothetical protein